MTRTRRNLAGRSVFAAGLALAGLVGARGARADTVTEWNTNLERAIFATAQPPAAQPRSSAIVHAAIYDAVNGIARKYDPYFVTEAAPRGARKEAAAAQAAYTALKALYPSQADALDEQLAASLASIAGRRGRSSSIARGRMWGEHVTNVILAWRSTDGWSTPPPPYFGGGAPGIWRSQPTATAADGTLPAAFSQMSVLVPFAMASPDAFRPGPPPALTSTLYATDLAEVEAIGRFDSVLRTAEQTQLALLWQAVGVVDENRIARDVLPETNSLVDNARLFALVNVAACDALIAGYDSKFAYNLWRPYHAIRLADTDGNPDTVADPAWNSLFPAPRFQEYASNHASLTGAFMRVLARELGDAHAFTLSSPISPYTATFGRFSEATAQVKDARIWAGIHFRNSCDVGEAMGVAIADHVVDTILRPTESEDE